MSSPRLTKVQWLICVIAAIGFAFDIYELLMLPLIIAPALRELVNVAPGTPAYNDWVGVMLWVPAIAGGIFGLLGGYLTDRLGRRRVLTWSILLYAFSAFAAGFSTTIWQFLFFRSLTFIGVCVEFVAAVSWLAELFPDAKQREKVLGYTQAFSSFGGALVTAASAWILANAASLPEIYGGHEAWRYTLMSGVVPALPLIIIRPFLPESPAWLAKKQAGTLRRPSVAQLFSPELRRTTIVTTLMFACSYGAAFGAIQHMPRIVPATPDVATMAPERPMPQDAPGAAVWRAESGRMKQQQAAAVQWWQEIGGLAGRTLLAMLVIVIASRRGLLRIFQVPGIIVVPLVFWFAPTSSLDTLKIGMFFAGLFTVAQFSFWGNYLPRVYPTHLRGTGEAFAANVGGRMLGTGFAFVTTTLASNLSGAPHVQLAMAATIVATFVYVAGFTLSFFLPEPKGTDLPGVGPPALLILLARIVFVAFVATLGDYVWFEFGVRHTPLHGVLHGAALLLAVGLVLGHHAGSVVRGAAGGVAAGVAGALAFYAVVGVAGYLGALIAAWVFMWIFLAALAAWLRGALRAVGRWAVPGVLAAVGSGLTFYLVSGIWTDHPESRNYLWHLVAWTVAWAPGIAALTWTREHQ